MTNATFKGGPLNGQKMALPNALAPDWHWAPAFNPVTMKTVKELYLIEDFPDKLPNGDWNAVYVHRPGEGIAL